MIKTIDVRNIPCPGPVIEAKNALKDMTQGTLELLVDNEIAVSNLTKLASYLNLAVTSEKIDHYNYKVTFQIGESVEFPAAQRDVVVAISSECMGEGDEVLGKALMKGFVYALTELDNVPGTILLYNGGAKLSVEDSEALADLQLLESQGAEIMTCGTCLNHYGLSEHLGVGTVTNMYVIAEKMTAAEIIVKP